MNTIDGLQKIKELRDNLGDYFAKADAKLLKNIREELYKTLPEAVPYSDFDKYGLKVNIDFLSAVGVSMAVMLPPEISADYCDIVTYENAQDENYEVKNWGPLHIQGMNGTSIGNLAYLSLYAKNETTKQQSRSALISIVIQLLDLAEKEVKKLN